MPPDADIGFIQTKIAAKHLTEVRPYQTLDHLAFREKLIEICDQTDLATAYLSQLNGILQDRDETISNFMIRVRNLVIKAHPEADQATRDRILISSFTLGLYDRQLASNLSLAKVATKQDAERLAAERESMRQHSRRSNCNVASEVTRPPEELDEVPQDEDNDGPRSEEKEKGDVSAAIGDSGR